MATGSHQAGSHQAAPQSKHGMRTPVTLSPRRVEERLFEWSSNSQREAETIRHAQSRTVSS
jgi:hypothetical protein